MEGLEDALQKLLKDPAQLAELSALVQSLGLGPPEPPSEPPQPKSAPPPVSAAPPEPRFSLRSLLPQSLDVGDVLLVLIFLLLLVDGEEDDTRSILLTLAAFFIL